MTRSGRRDEWLPVAVTGAAAGAWAFVTLVYVVVCFGVPGFLGSTVCVGPGDSNYGTLGWSVLPPGPTCTYWGDAGPYTTGPGSFYVFVDVVLLVGLVIVVAMSVWAGRHAWRRHRMPAQLR